MQDEYLITNRLGAYSSSTFHFGNTRKYHGLLIVSNDNVERKVLVNRLEEVVEFRGRRENLNTNLYKDGVIAPDGHKWIKNYQIDPEVSIDYEIEFVRINKSLRLLKYANKVVVIYQVDSPIPLSLRVRPLITNRSIHSLRSYGDTNLFGIEENDGSVRINVSENEDLQIEGGYSEFNEEKLIYYNFDYPQEAKRGYESIEDLISIGTFAFNLPSGKHLVELSFSYTNTNENAVTKFKHIEKYYNRTGPRDILESLKLNNSKLNDLRLFLDKRAEDFILSGRGRTSINAGFHWFEDWGRDTFISLRGLLLCRGKYNLARTLIEDWADLIKNGLVPNRPGVNEYNSLDATLWFVVSIYYYLQETNDKELPKKLLPKIANIIQNLIIGTDYDVSMLKNGFLSTTDRDHALTWMDAVVEGKPVTPRSGSAVEIQMLWYNILCIYKDLENQFNKEGNTYYVDILIRNLKTNFNRIFWVKRINYLADYLDGQKLNIQIRPNPVLGLSLPFSPLNSEQESMVLEKVSAKLLTPCGLRTLPVDDPSYKGSYEGDQFTRDFAYHNGTVWPWLLGLYLKSYLRVNFYSTDSRYYVSNKLIEFWEFLESNRLSYVPEVFSSNELKPGGCISQAWNYATLIEVLYDLNMRNDDRNVNI